MQSLQSVTGLCPPWILIYRTAKTGFAMCDQKRFRHPVGCSFSRSCHSGSSPYWVILSTGPKMSMWHKNMIYLREVCLVSKYQMNNKWSMICSSQARILQLPQGNGGIHGPSSSLEAIWIQSFGHRNVAASKRASENHAWTIEPYVGLQKFWRTIGQHSCWSSQNLTLWHPVFGRIRIRIRTLQISADRARSGLKSPWLADLTKPTLLWLDTPDKLTWLAERLLSNSISHPHTQRSNTGGTYSK